jgi:abortive infection bacteriophage resistance protein
MTAMQTKRWKSTEEQLELLKSRGMTVPDEERALHFLRRVGYYRLSGYFYPFRIIEECDNDAFRRSDQFIEASNFDDVIALYLFDRKLRLLALDALERIELAVQVDIAYLLGRHDPFAHHDHRFLDKGFVKKTGNFGYQGWLENYHSLLKRSKAAFVEHNLAKYGRLPIWAAVEVFDFGCLSVFFNGINGRDKQAISAKYGFTDGKSIASWLRSLNYIRNVSAHHGRLWNCNVVERASVPRNFEQLRTVENERSFLYFCIMKHMLDVICPDSSWGNRFKKLTEAFPNVRNGAVSIEKMGVPDGWKSWELWQ